MHNNMALLFSIVRYFILYALLFCGGAFAFAAPDLTEGEWEVEAVQADGYNARLEAKLVFTSQIAVANGYQVEGYFDWLCRGDSQCHGRELFRGFLSRTGRLTLAGEKIIAHPEYGGPLNLWPANYTAHVGRDGNSLERGRWPARGIPEGEWRAIRKTEEGEELWEWVKAETLTWPHPEHQEQAAPPSFAELVQPAFLFESRGIALMHSYDDFDAIRPIFQRQHMAPLVAKGQRPSIFDGKSEMQFA
jgi:hypothetical protein